MNNKVINYEDVIRSQSKALAERRNSEIDEFVKRYTPAPIQSADEYNEAGQLLRQIRTHYAQIETEREGRTKPLHDLKTWIISLYKSPLTKLEALRQAVNSRMAEWEQRQRAEAERQRQLLIKAQQKEQEKQAKQLEKQAVKMEKVGDLQGADMLRTEAQEIKTAEPSLPALAIEKPKAEGVSTRTIWRWRVKGAKHLEVISRAKYPDIPDDYWCLNEAMLTRMVQAANGQITIAGIETYPEIIRPAKKLEG